MKFISVITSLLIIGGILLSPGRKNLKGTWRIDTSQSDCNNPVIRIKMHQGIWKGTMDSPEQEKYDEEIQSVRSDKDSVRININGFQKIRAKWMNDTLMKGVLQSGDMEIEIEMAKQ